MNDISRINFLVGEILRNKQLYYKGMPKISDVAYDKLEEELRAISPDHPVLSYVGGVSDSKFRKVVHKVPMLSLAKTYSISELCDWVDGQPVMATLKVDGVSMSLNYQDGILLLGKTRGNGREGEDVTDKILWVGECIPQISLSGDGEVRGELCCSEESFIKLADEMVTRGLECPTNPRNIVSGILGRKNHQDLARFFDFYAFDLIVDEQRGLFSTEFEKYNWLEKAGFKVPQHKLCRNPQEIERYLIFARDFLDAGEIGVDGVVFSFNDLAYHHELGATSHHPRYKMSFKWAGETGVSEIREITWATSRLGIVTPVAVINPIYLSGASITNVTLHNAAHVRTHHLKSGDKIEVIRSGEVIPKFLSVVQSASGTVSIPTRCPSCQSELFFDGIRLICQANFTCPAQLSGAILNWIKAVNIEDLSEKRLQQLIDGGLVKRISDLYQLTEADFLKLPATRETMANKLIKNIEITKAPELVDFLNGLGIPGMGVNSWNDLCKVAPSLQSICTLKIEDIEAIDGFANKTAVGIVKGLMDRVDLIQSLLKVGVKPKESTVQEKGTKLSGLTFVITGALSRPRSEIEKIIIDQGGKVVGSVSKNTNILLTNDQDVNSTKAKKAKELGIDIWNETNLDSYIS